MEFSERSPLKRPIVFKLFSSHRNPKGKCRDIKVDEIVLIYLSNLYHIYIYIDIIICRL